MSTRERTMGHLKTFSSGVKNSAVLKKAAFYAVNLFCGFLFSRSTVFTQYAPFGVAAVAAVPYSGMWAALAGAVLGYIFPSSVSIPARYIAAAVAAAAIRWTMSDLKKIRSHFAFTPAVAFLPMIATGITVVLLNGSFRSTAAFYAAESLLCAGSAYFFSGTASFLSERKGLYSLTFQETACLVLTLGVAILSFSGMTVAGVSIGNILAVTVILFASRYGGIAAGAISGITAGAVLSLSSMGLSYLSGAYALGGLVAGIFAPMGKLVGTAAFVIANGIASLQIGDRAGVVTGLYEVAAASILFLIIPVKDSPVLTGMFSKGKEQPFRTDGLRKCVTMKLGIASRALGDVSETVEKISKKLSCVCARDLNEVYKKTTDEVCTGCGMRTYCWNKNYNAVMGALNDLSILLHENGHIENADFHAPLSVSCIRLSELTTGINRRYREFLSREAADSRVAQIRSVVTEQFGTTAKILSDMAKELELYEQFDFETAEKISGALHGMEIHAQNVSCRTDKFGRMTVELEASLSKKQRICTSAISRELSKVCGRRFSPPCVSDFANNQSRIQCSEAPSFSFALGYAQHVCGGGELCGDSFTSFDDGCGREILIVSDGMGTGGRAAVDGAMASGIMEMLLKAGIGFDCALRVTNSALIAKSRDESLSTVDMAAVDLFSGKTEFFKAGAPVSYVRKEKKAVRIDAPALPVGILRDAEFSKADVSLSAGDLVFLFTDGVIASGDGWLTDLIETEKGDDPKVIAEKIIREARQRRTDGHDDDITAVVLRLDAPQASLA